MKKLSVLFGMMASVFLLASAHSIAPCITMVALFFFSGGGGAIAFFTSIAGLMAQFVLGFVVAGGLTRGGLVFAL